MNGYIAWWDDALVGDRRTSYGRTITESDLCTLNGLVGNYAPLHSDAEYAKTTIFGQRVVNATMSIVIASGMRANMIWYNGDNFCGISMIAFLGYDKMRFPSPLFINDTIHLESVIREKRLTGKPGRGIIIFEDTVVKQDGTVVATWERAMMYRTRPDGEVERE